MRYAFTAMIVALVTAMIAAAAMAAVSCSGTDAPAPGSTQTSDQPQQQSSSEASSATTEQSTQPAQQESAASTQAHQQPQQTQQTQQTQQPQRPKQTQPQPSQAELETEAVPDGTRIVSLFGDITEILFALELEDYIVGVDVSSVYPDAAQDLPDVGFAGALNAEGVLQLAPTIVIGGSIVAPGPPGVLDQLEQAGVEVLILPELISLDGPGFKIRAIGDAIGIPERAESLAQRVERDIAVAQPKADGATESGELSVLFVYLRRGGIQLVSGAGREAETIITAAGGVDAGAAAGIDGWQPLTPEALVAINPDVYLVMELGYDAVGGLDGLLAIPGMAETAAGQHQRVIVMEDIFLLGFGPRMADSIVQLRDYLAEVRQTQKTTASAE